MYSDEENIRAIKAVSKRRKIARASPIVSTVETTSHLTIELRTVHISPMKIMLISGRVSKT